ncbi:hypothetical protein GOQ27_13370 [Clostridium sp. D2Q-11]|uniref:Uncharacterized protein n=1 Tax=Anaeromonas frigoriresistens TaxID=2683708 RepID=A0A942UWN6_9FIRM|nr:hypothetical protein [Anaeromonas frigoriresistens]MBS4539460.1 hypothetical protein [Anaeromonas frigoriresistens]
MKSYIEKELIEVQVEHIKKEIKKVEMMIRNQYDDTFHIATLRCNYEIDIEDVETLEEKLDVYKTWYEKVLYLQLEFQEEYESSNEDVLISGIDY